MVIDMNDAKLVTLEQLRGFLAGAADLSLTPTAEPVARYGFIKQVLKRFKYPLQGKAHRGLIRRYLQRVTGYSRPQLTRLIAQYLRSGRLVRRYRATKTSYTRKFTPEDSQDDARRRLALEAEDGLDQDVAVLEYWVRRANFQTGVNRRQNSTTWLVRQRASIL